MKQKIAAALLWKRISPTDDRRRAAEAFCRNMQAEQRQLTAKYDRALAKACLEEKAVTEFARKAAHPMAPSMPQTQTALCLYATQIAAYPAGVGLHDSMSSACITAKDSPHWAACVAEAARLAKARRAEQLALLPPQATAKCITAVGPTGALQLVVAADNCITALLAAGASMPTGIRAVTQNTARPAAVDTQSWRKFLLAPPLPRAPVAASKPAASKSAPRAPSTKTRAAKSLMKENAPVKKAKPTAAGSRKRSAGAPPARATKLTSRFIADERL
ncbi:hypothetical protein M885DRAFT_569687 [Pelagophyceae sp. CCMP2097]|nr:hypothetical protein M885DRAFT_569687 [Pelagophyceae sp. CCMP2097]